MRFSAKDYISSVDLKPDRGHKILIFPEKVSVTRTKKQAEL